MQPQSLVITLLALLLLLVPAVVVWRIVRATQYTPKQAVFWLFAKAFTQILWRAKVEGSFPKTEDGKAVVICNHRSSIDPFFIQTSLDRVVHWMVAREYCEHWLFGPFIRIAEVIPVNRGGVDIASTKSAIRYAAAGGMVGMLPEGRINTTDELMLAVRPGAIIVALKAHAPIVPCFIEGAPYKGTVWSPFFMRARVRVWFGPPIDLSSDYGQERNPEVVQRRLKQCIRAIAKLAGQEDFEVVVAGRHWHSKSTDPDE